MTDRDDTHRHGRRRREDPVRAAARRRHHLWLLLLAVLVTFAAALPGDYVWTDHRDLQQAGARLTDADDLGRAFTLTREQLRESRLGTTPETARGAWRPLATLNHTLDHWLVGDCSVCLHAENLAWHVLIVLGLYVLGRRLLARRPHGKTLAFWSALLFAVHPVATVPVAFIGARDLLLGSALAIAALVAFTRLPVTTGSQPNGLRRWLLAVPVFTFGALLSHEAVAVLPLVAAALTWFELRERGRSGLAAVSRSRRLAIALMLSAIAAYTVLRGQLVGMAFTAEWPGGTPVQTLATLLGLFWHGLGQVFWPGEPVLSDVWPLAPGLDPAATAGLLALLLAIGATLWGLRHHQPLALGGAWFLLWYLPVSGVFPLQRLHDDTHLYPAAWGLILGAVVTLYRLWRPLGRQLSHGAETLVFTPVAVALGLLTAVSCLRFSDDAALFAGELDLDPYYLEGRVMLAAHALRQGQPLEALNQGTLALEAAGEDEGAPLAHWPAADAHLYLAQAQFALALLEDAQRNFTAARDLLPRRAAPWYGLGLVHLQQQRWPEAVTALQAAYDRRPNHPHTRQRLAEALLRDGRTVQGMALLLPMVEQGGADAAVLVALADTYARQGNPTAAIAHLRLALQARDDPVTRARLARLLWHSGQGTQAQTEITRALRAGGDEALVNEVAAEIAAGFPATLPGTL